MRKVLLIAVSALALNACVPSTGNQQVDAILAQAQAIAKQICGIEIIAAQIVALIPNPVLIGPTAIANALCRQVLASSRRFGGRLGGTFTTNVRIGGNVVAVTVRR